MKRITFLHLIVLFLAIVIPAACGKTGAPAFIVIAHRGASGYLPEHSMESKALAYAQRPDYIEQDVALTKDDRAVVIHDHYLDTVSDVARVCPQRARTDGRFYVIDFTLAELRRLRFHERVDLATGKPVYPKRFPLRADIGFSIHTLEEELALIQGLNASTGANVGVYPEIKAPWFHEREGKDIVRIVIGILARYGYTDKHDNCCLQCFDPRALRRIRFELRSRLRLVQLIADNSWDETPGVDYNAMLAPSGLDAVAGYADGIGPWLPQVIAGNGSGKPACTGLIALAHQRGLVVHPYTVRADELPAYARDIRSLLAILIGECGADGVFTDFPDRVIEYRNARR